MASGKTKKVNRNNWDKLVASHEGASLFRRRTGSFLLNDREIGVLEALDWCKKNCPDKVDEIFGVKEETVTVSVRIPRSVAEVLKKYCQENNVDKTYVVGNLLTAWSKNAVKKVSMLSKN